MMAGWAQCAIDVMQSAGILILGAWMSSIVRRVNSMNMRPSPMVCEEHHPVSVTPSNRPEVGEGNAVERDDPNAKAQQSPENEGEPLARCVFYGAHDPYHAIISSDGRIW
ncbi:hypothetical protein G1C95_1128 [Bifidobacterium sp. DSM 109957]|uniref:Uncharacterized protein n=1 Tax=Bifidobacterium oedipodis TaxID=2675322 RepID=A0A7Y0ERD6_9BIFI|nr:hypothetical protein [Bifidobacterium sp. DSM 109957]